MLDKIVLSYDASKLIKQSRGNIMKIFGDGPKRRENAKVGAAIIGKIMGTKPSLSFLDEIELDAVKLPEDLKRIILKFVDKFEVVPDPHYGWDNDFYKYDANYKMFSSQLMPFVSKHGMSDTEKQKMIDDEIEDLLDQFGSREDIPGYMIPDYDTLEEYPKPIIGVHVFISLNDLKRIIISAEDMKGF